MPTPRSRPQRRRDTEHRLTHDIDVWVARVGWRCTRQEQPPKTKFSTRKLHKRLHTHCTIDDEQVNVNAKAPTYGALQSPLTDSNR